MSVGRAVLIPLSHSARIRLRARTWIPALCVAGGLLLASCTVTPHRGRAGEHWQKTAIGLCEDYPEETRSIAAARQDLAAAHAAGATVLRIAFGWDAMEPEPGKYDWTFWDDFVQLATSYNIRLIPYVCYTPKWAATDQGKNYWRSPPRDPADFARFVAVLVRRYHTRIHSWELWNEPDNQAYWLGSPAQFAALVRAGSASVRRVDPKATIVLGGIAGELDFLAKLLRDEELGPFVDVINIHSYYETWHPSPIEHLPAYIDAAHGLIADTGGRQALWMAETGYSSVGDRADVSGVYRAHFRGEHTEAAQAGALVRTFATALATEKLSLIAWYRINDLTSGQDVIGDDNNRHLGLRRVDGAAKPALGAFTFIAQRFERGYETLAPSFTMEGNASGQPEVRAFRVRDDHRIVFAWLSTPDEPAAPRPGADVRSANVQIVVPGVRASNVRFRNAQGQAIAGDDATWREIGSETKLMLTLRGGEVVIAEITP